MKIRRSCAAIAVAASVVGSGLVTAAPSMATVSYTSGDQASQDTAAVSQSNGTWGDYSAGVGARPYVQSLSVTNGGSTTSVISGGSVGSPTPVSGDLAPVVSPVNLCKIGQGAGSGCYSTPNRVQISFGAQGSGQVDTDLANVGNQTINANSIIDATIKLNSFSSALRWSQLNGRLLYWQTSGLGTSDAVVRVRFNPVTTPGIDWSQQTGGGCTATPIFDCNIAQADGSYLGASLLFSLDDTLDPALTGAAFATQGAISGFLLPGGSATSPTLDLQVASSHLTSNGDLNTGGLQAFLPSQSLINLYGVLPEDGPTFFTATRTGSSGTNAAPTFARWSAGVNGGDGLLVDVAGITFSAPTYQVARKSAAVTTAAKYIKKTKKTKVTAGKIGACKTKKCNVFVYRLAASKNSAAATWIATYKLKKGKKLNVSLAKKKLAKGNRYLVVVRKGSSLVTTSMGTVR